MANLLPERPWYKEERLPGMEHLPLPLGCRDSNGNANCWVCDRKWAAAACRVGMCLDCHRSICRPNGQVPVSPQQLTIE